MDNLKYYDVIIAGAGPVGLLLGLRLNQLGLNFLILEKRTEPHSNSRSIGIHPPALEVFDEIGLSKPLISTGICIRKGKAFHDKNQLLGTLDFGLCPKPHNYVLVLPQFQTEHILRKKLLEKSPGSLKNGVEVTNFRQNNQHINVEFHDGDKPYTIKSSYLAGCDGKASTIRRKAGIAFNGYIYPYRYAMGDFEDNTTFENDAAIYAGKHGLVESFPLAGKARRWVAELPSGMNECSLPEFCNIIFERAGFILDQSSNTMFSLFKAECFLAGTFRSGRVLLAGDSAHLLSPIGGQGMNLGWLDAWQLGEALQKTLKQGPVNENHLIHWGNKRKKKAGKAIKNSEFNMALGQRTAWPCWRKFLIKRLINYPFNRMLARKFTMRGLS